MKKRNVSLCSVDRQGLLGQGVEAAHAQLPLPAPGAALGGGWRQHCPTALGSEGWLRLLKLTAGLLLGWGRFVFFFFDTP